jgi:hypothetical protein
MKALVILERWENVRKEYPSATKQRYRDFSVAISNRLLNDSRVSWVEVGGCYFPDELWCNSIVRPAYMVERDYDMVLTFGVNERTFAGRAGEYYASLDSVIHHHELLYSWEKYYEQEP